MRHEPQIDPEVVSASHWGATRPRSPLPRRGALDHLVVHHTAYHSTRIGGTTLEAQSHHMRQIERWHLDRGFLNVSLWRDDVCVETFHLAPNDAARLAAFIADGLFQAAEHAVGQ